MKASELRIGNWIKGAEGTAMPHDFQVEGWHINAMVQFENTFRRFVNWQPIPLTREWLLKFGFEDNSYAVFYKQFNGSEYIRISFKDYAHTQLTERPVDVSDFDLDIQCIYVHQLQNLYFALTGEELTITK
jgi:hypothetical protein